MKAKRKHQVSAINNLKAVLLDPEGNGSIQGSKKDNKIIEESLAEIENQLTLFVYDKLKKKDIDDVIDDFIETLDFDGILRWATVLDVEINYPPLKDMWPDWQNELAIDVGKAMAKV